MNHSTTVLPVLHQLLEFTQTHVHWIGDAIQSSSVIPFSSCPQSFPASGSFPMSQLFTWGGQSTGVSVLASVLLMNTQDWPPLGWTGWISLQSKGLSRVFSNTTVQKHQFCGTQLSSHKPTILLLIIYLTEMKACAHMKSYLWMLIYNSVIHVTPNYKQPNCLSMGERIIKMCYIHTMVYYSNKKEAPLTHSVMDSESPGYMKEVRGKGLHLHDFTHV